MADMNYVSPLTSDLTDYYTKSEVDELQQGDAATYATSAEIVAGDNAVKGWVVSQGFLTEHQDLTNYATISYVDDAIAAIEPSSGGMAVRVVSTLPGVGEENVLYLVFVDNEDEDNRYAEYIWVDTLNDYEMLGYSSSEGGIIPDLTDYATKQWVEAKGYLTAVDAKDISYDNAASGLEAANIKNAIDEVNAKVEAIDVPDVSEFATESFVDAGINNAINNLTGNLSTVATTGSYNDLTNKPAIPTVPANVSAFTNDAGYLTAHQDISGKANTADLATVAFSGDYDDLANKPSIPSTSGLASESYVDAAIGNLSIPTSLSDLDNDMNFVDEAMAKAAAIDEINNNVSAAGLSGSYNDLDDKPVIPTVPTNVSSFTNDAGYLTSHQDISGKVDGTVVSGTTTAKIFNEVDGGGAQIITDSARGFAGVHDGSNPDATYATMYVKNADGTSTLARVDLDGDGKAYYLKNGASKAAGSEIAVKDDIPAAPDLTPYATKAELTAKADAASLASVATSGDYDDLTNKPTIPSITGLATETYVDNAVAGISVPAKTSDLTNDSGFITSSDLPDTSGFVESSDLATVATTGDYDDLTNKPTIPVLPTLATVATSGSYNDLSDKPTIQEGGLNTLAGALFAILTSDTNINYIVKTASTKSDVLDYYNQGYIVNYTGSSVLQLNPEDFGTVTNITYYDFQVTNITTGAYSTGFFTSGNVTMAVNSNTMICKLTDVVPMRFSKRNGMNWREVFDLIISKTLLKYSNTTSGLTATTIQAAIDELAAASGSGSAVGWSYDSSTGYMTFTGMLDNNL